jgi:hypothetical protein
MTAKIMYRHGDVSRPGRDLKSVLAARIPRPVVAIYFSLHALSHENESLYPIGASLRQEINLILPTIPLQVPGSKVAISVHDNRNDQLSDVLLLPPLRAEEYAVMADARHSNPVFLKLQPQTVQRVEGSRVERKACDPSPGYSKYKVIWLFGI